MANLVTTCGAVIAAGFLVGCGTVQQAYKPQQLGNLADNRNDSNIEVSLRPDKSMARIGEPITFTIEIRNIGSEPILFPSDPDLLMTWVYPDGKRDNLIRDKRRGGPEMRMLRPGETYIAHSVVTTYYFDHAGIHEFRAVVYGERDLALNSRARPAWDGRAVSNGFGLLFEGH